MSAKIILQNSDLYNIDPIEYHRLVKFLEYVSCKTQYSNRKAIYHISDEIFESVKNIISSKYLYIKTTNNSVTIF